MTDSTETEKLIDVEGIAKNMISEAMREEVGLFIKGGHVPVGDGVIYCNESVLLELAMNCAGRTSQILLQKLSVLDDQSLQWVLGAYH